MARKLLVALALLIGLAGLGLVIQAMPGVRQISLAPYYVEDTPTMVAFDGEGAAP